MQRASRSKVAEFLRTRIDYERTIPVPYGRRTFQLDRMRALLAALGDPHAGLRAVHIAGTKGKGSTAAMIGAALSAAGQRVGLFTSPHLERTEERIAIDGRPCATEDLTPLVERIRPIVETMDREAGDGAAGPTFFEIVTALAFCRFAEENVDCAVLEVGLGGRLDATNVCRAVVSVITSISFDHTQLLGDTLEAIAREKAGIIKPATPVILGALSPGPQGVVESVAAPLGAPLRSLGRDFRFDYRPPERLDIAASRGLVDFVDDVSGGFGAVEGVEVGLVGPHQAANAAVALAALGELRRQGWSIPESAAREGLAGVRWPARMEVVRRAPAIVVDAAHNVASIEALLATLDQSFSARRRLAIFATSRDKDARGMLQLLLPRFDRLLLSRYTTNPRGAPIDELLNISQQIAAGNEFQAAQVAAFPNLAAAWDAARAWLGPEDLAVVTGSFYTAGEMLTLIRK